MDQFNIEIKWRENSFNLHPSYFEMIKQKIAPVIQEKLIKAGYDGGHFIVRICQRQLEYYYDQPSIAVIIDHQNHCYNHSEWIATFDVVCIDTSWGITHARKDYKMGFKLDPNKEVNKDNLKLYIENFTKVEPPFHIYEAEMEKAAQKEAEKFEKFLKDNCNFEVELAFEDYPDIIFEIYFDVDITDELTEKTLEVMSKFINSWNRKRERQGLEGYIHYIDDARRTIENPAKNAAYIHVDMGDANLTALKHLLKSLNKPYLPIKNIVIS